MRQKVVRCFTEDTTLDLPSEFEDFDQLISLLQSESNPHDTSQLDKYRLMLLGCAKIKPSFHELPAKTKSDMLHVFKKVILAINNSWVSRCAQTHDPTINMPDS